MTRILHDLTSKRFGKVLVNGRAKGNDKSGNARWLCQCRNCGREFIEIGTTLRRKKSLCSCTKRDGRTMWDRKSSGNGTAESKRKPMSLDVDLGDLDDDEGPVGIAKVPQDVPNSQQPWFIAERNRIEALEARMAKQRTARLTAEGQRRSA